MSIIKYFGDLLKRGNLPGDDRNVPNWMKIKNRQFDDVDFSKNKVDDIIALSSDEFNEFASLSDNSLLFTFLMTLSKRELKKFYQYNEVVVKLDESIKSKSSKEQFEEGMEKAKKWKITDEQRARASLEVPLMVNASKNIYHKTMAFQRFVSQDYYNYDIQNEFKMYEGNFVKIIWAEMKYIPDHFEQIIDHFKEKFYDESNEAHKAFFKHLSKRFGLLIATLDRLVVMTENRESSLNWFVSKMMEYDLVDTVEISVSESASLSSDQKLINFLTLTFLGICEENDDNYLSGLISVVQAYWEWYPINRTACEYAMVEMMKSVALKKVNEDNAHRFLNFFETLPRFYSVLSYDNIFELKELVSYVLSNQKPQDNEVFEKKGLNELILLNYMVDMEDIYYEGLKNNE